MAVKNHAKHFKPNPMKTQTFTAQEYRAKRGEQAFAELRLYVIKHLVKLENFHSKTPHFSATFIIDATAPDTEDKCHVLALVIVNKNKWQNGLLVDFNLALPKIIISDNPGCDEFLDTIIDHERKIGSRA
jgi:hypothetical protein